MKSQNISFWEREELLRADYIVVGAGIIGLSAAISLKEKYPPAEILILEQEILPSGASSKNAGFACFGSLTEFLADLDTLGPEKTVEIVTKRKAGFDLLLKRLGEKRLEYDRCGGYELLWEKDAAALDRLRAANELLKPIFGSAYFENRDELIEQFGFNAKEVKYVVANRFEGTINTGLMIKNLALLAAELGIRIITGAAVQEVNEDGQTIRVTAKRACSGERVDFCCKSAIVATNALAPELTKGCKLTPGRGQVLITEPIANLKLRGAFFFDQGFYYFRNVGSRLLFGGGRNSDFVAETTTCFETTKAVQSKLDELLSTVILPGIHFQIDLRWSGIMGFSESYEPVVKNISPKVVVAFGCNGMGVALGTSVGAEAAGLIV